MGTTLKSAFLIESSQVIDQLGNTFILNLYARLREIEAVARSLALTVEHLPRSPRLFHQVIPSVLNFQGDLSIAGGGVWFEPYRFAPQEERCSFFWGRSSAGDLVYFDDYNQSEAGYHREAWYVVGHYARPGQCLWSKSYMDPYSQELMITCTTAFFCDTTFAGVVTVDLKLEGLQATVDRWQRETGGYIFVLDRHNQFITFPDLNRVRKVYQNEAGKSLQGFISLQDFVAQEDLFNPLLKVVEQMDARVLAQAPKSTDTDLAIATGLSQKSHQISYEEGKLLAAIISDPLHNQERTDYLYRKFQLEQDSLLQEPAIAFLFQVPQVYWKVFIIKPRSEIHAATHNVIQADKMATLGQMLAGVAHELNNPLNFLVGNLVHAKNYVNDLLAILTLYQTTYPDPSQEIQAAASRADLPFLMQDLPKLLKSMQIGADRTLEIIRALRHVSRSDGESYQTMNLHEGIENTLLLLNDRLRDNAEGPKIQVIREYGSLPLVECFPGQINQVFMNLIVNAIDALKEVTKSQKNDESALLCPTIRICTGVIDKQRVVVRIIDNGLGMAPEIQERLFRPFFTTKPFGKGTGLGLAICRQIIADRHRGQIVCHSAPGQGTEFVLELPVQAPSSRRPRNGLVLN